MQDPAITLNTDNAYFEVKPDSVATPHVEVALTVLVSQFPGIVRGMVRQVTTREYAVRLYLASETPHGALEETWVRVKDVPYAREEVTFGQYIGNPPVLWGSLIERALQDVHMAQDLQRTLQALTGRTAFEAVSSREALHVLWSAVSAANFRALVIARMGDALLGVLGAYTDKDGTRRVVVQHRQETLDMPLARYLMDADCTYVLRK